MKGSRLLHILALLVTACIPTAFAVPVGTAFTYQGELLELGLPANGNYDMEFHLYDVAMDGAPLGSIPQMVEVSDGIFTAELDFGINVFDGEQLWLEIVINPTDPEATVLSPRQKLTATPFALQALSVVPGSIGEMEVDSSQIQMRVSPGCESGEYIQEINIDGTPVCAPDMGGSGTVTQVDSGTGLTGGPITTSGTLSVDTSVVQQRVTGSCPEGNYMRIIDSSGMVTCSPDASGAVSGVCPAGMVVAGIFADGSLNCQPLPKERIVSTVNESGGYTLAQTLALEIGGDGLPVIAARDNTLSDVVVFKCNDPGCAGDDETLSTISTESTFHVDIAMGDDGFPTVSFYDTAANGLFLVKCNDAACAGGDDPTNTVEDPTNDVGDHNSLAIGDDGFPVMSYDDSTDGLLKVAKCSDTDCSGGKTINVLNPTHIDTRDTSIAIGEDGFPIVAFLGGNASDGFGLWVAKCNDSACAGNDESLTLITDTAETVWDTSLAIGTDGLPVISYAQSSDGSLWVARCNDVACSGEDETLSMVDDDVNALGAFHSLAIGTDGFPVIAYYEATSFDVRVAKCNDAACDGGDEEITVVDETDQVGRFVDIAVTPDGLPVLAYEDQTNSLVKVLRCATSDCRD